MDGSAQHTTKEVEAVGPGTILGEYALGARIERRLNADVYEATSTSSGAPRIVYVLRPDAVSDHPFVHQVICEVDAARWLRHPAVAKVDGYGDTPSGGMYVAADRPPGRTLFTVLAEGGKMTPRRVVRMAHRLVEVLEEAHNVGLVHGRLSPAAILVSEELDAAGNPLMTLTGFGTGAVALDGDISAAEQPYVSPERMAGRELDVRADVYGLASILHHALVGDAPAIPAAKAEIADGSSLADVIAAARAADVKRRPATVKAFWEDLLAALVDEAADAQREEEVDLLPALLPPPVVSRPSAPMFGPPLPQGGPAAWPVLDARLDMLAPPQAAPALPAAPVAMPAPTTAAPPPMPAAASARHSGGADVWGSSSLPTLAPMAAAPVPSAPPAPLALDPMPAAPPTAETTPASVRVAAEPPPPHVQFREAWERHGPPPPPSTAQPPRRRRRTALALLWWLAVPAAGAAAASWPLSSGGDERVGGVSNSTAAFSMVPGQPLQAAPPVADTGADADEETPDDELRTADSRGDVVMAAPRAEPAAEAEREAAPAPRRLPRVAPVNLPDVSLPGVELPKRSTTVRSSDFPVAPPGGR